MFLVLRYETIKLEENILFFTDSPSVQPFPASGFLQVKLGEEVRMSCKGSGVPYPIISWASKVIIHVQKVL